MPANNYLLETESDLLYDPVRYDGIDQVVVDNDNNTIGLSASFISTVNNKLDTSTFTAYTANHASDDVTPYSAGNNINITNHVISGKDWSSVISNAVSPKLDTTTFNSYTANHASDDVTPYSGGAGISVSNHLISCTGEITPYSAGANINVTNHVISGKDWTNTITSATSGKLDTSTFNTYSGSHSADDNTPYSAGANINITNHVISGKDWTSTINSSISSKLDTSTYNSYTAAHVNDDNTPYSAGTDIKINNHIIGIDTNGTATNGSNNFVAGYNTYAKGSYNIVAGYNCSAYLQSQNSNYNAVFGNNNLAGGYETLVAGVGCTALATRSIVMGDSNSAKGRNLYVFGTNNTMSSDGSENSVSVCIGQSNTMNTCSGTYLFGNNLTGDNNSYNRIKMGFGNNYLEINGNGTFYKVVGGTASEIQNKLSDITDVQVVSVLPASPVANVLYLVKE